MRGDEMATWRSTSRIMQTSRPGMKHRQQHSTLGRLRPNLPARRPPAAAAARPRGGHPSGPRTAACCRAAAPGRQRAGGTLRIRLTRGSAWIGLPQCCMAFVLLAAARHIPGWQGPSGLHYMKKRHRTHTRANTPAPRRACRPRLPRGLPPLPCGPPHRRRAGPSGRPA